MKILFLFSFLSTQRRVLSDLGNWTIVTLNALKAGFIQQVQPHQVTERHVGTIYSDDSAWTPDQQQAEQPKQGEPSLQGEPAVKGKEPENDKAEKFE